MTRLRVLLSKITGIFRKAHLEQQLDEDVRAHLEMLTQENLRKGMDPGEARYAALRQFGNVGSMKEECRETWSIRLVEELAQDVRYAFRQLRRNPGFTAVAVLTLALGIGANTAIFSVLYGTLLAPWPYKDIDRLAALVGHDRERPGMDGNPVCSNPSEFLDYKEKNHVFDAMIGGFWGNVVLTGVDVPASWVGMWVTPNTFRVLGVPPLIGRTISPEDGKPGATPVVVLSYRVWQKDFGGDPGIVGQSLDLNRQPTTVIGVMPPRFRWFHDGGAGSWFPATFTKGVRSNLFYPTPVIGHLKPGVTIAQASAEMELLSRQFASAYPIYHRPGRTFTVEALTESLVGGESRTTLELLLGGVGLLLLIACVNVANLLLARASNREHEITIRAALGAGRGRLIRQFMIESTLLALGGSALGWLVASAGLGTLVALIPSWYLPREAAIRMNFPVLLFTAGIVLLSTVLFGLGPAVISVRRDLQTSLNLSGRAGGESRAHHRARGLLVVSEVALSLVLLTGAGLLVRSFDALLHVQTGYEPNHVLDTGTDLPGYRYKSNKQRGLFCDELLRRLRALPGVVSVAFGDPGPVGPGYNPEPFEIVGKPGAGRRNAWGRVVSDGFFRTLGIPLVQGRVISEEDMSHARRVAVVNRAFVRELFGNENPLGQQVRSAKPAQPRADKVRQPSFQIVGVVADTRYDAQLPAQPAIYYPYTTVFGGYPRYSGLFVRTRTAPQAMIDPLRRAVAALDKEMPLDWTVLRDDLDKSWYTKPRFVMGMLTGFALLGMVLVCIGVYGVLSYAVSQRTREIGIRMALGARAADVRHMVLKWGLRWLAIGIGIGVPASIALEKVLQNRIWGIKSADPLTMVAVSLVLTAVGLLACYFPARRASKVDPMVALRYE